MKLNGVAFTQQIDNDLTGILLFKSLSKAKLVLNIMKGIEDLSSLDENLMSVFDSRDIDDIPEFEESELSETITIQNGKQVYFIKIINLDDIPDIE